MTLLQEAAQTGIVAIGFTLVLITAGIDMSVGAVIAITSMLCVNFLDTPTSPPTCSSPWPCGRVPDRRFNGYFITRFRLPEFIVTLATRGLLSGLALIIAVKDPEGFVKNVFIQD